MDCKKEVNAAMISFLGNLVCRHPGRIVMLAVADSANNGDDISSALYGAMRSILSATLADNSIGFGASYTLISRLGANESQGKLLSESGPSPESSMPVSTKVCTLPVPPTTAAPTMTAACTTAT